MVVVKLALLAAGAHLAAAQFSLTVGNAVAAQIPGVKSISLSVRAGGCAEPSSVKLTASAMRMEGGVRVSVSLIVIAAETAGVFGIGSPSRPGPWTYVIAGDCQKQTAGLIVPMPDRGPYDRTKVETFSHAPTDVEIGAALREGGQT